jgi:predicted nucleic acid-binding protein
MPARPELFLDSSALFSGVFSPVGAARALLLLGEAKVIGLTVSEQVITETEQTLARKAPNLLSYYREAVRKTHLRIVANPTPVEVAAHVSWMVDPDDVPILVAAMKVNTDFLVTLNRRHFLDDPSVAQRANVRIGTPGDALAWVRPMTSRSEVDPADE